jgi:predicted RecB family nuclease
VLDKHSNIPFVHWHRYERMKLDLYIDRYGDRDGTAKTIKYSLFDLLPAMQNAVALPLPSYSLKVVEGYVGFKRSQSDYGGAWAMARYLEATEQRMSVRGNPSCQTYANITARIWRPLGRCFAGCRKSEIPFNDKSN